MPTINLILLMPAVIQLTGLSRSTIYTLRAAGEFPRPVRLSTRAVGWREADIRNWLASRLEQGA